MKTQGQAKKILKDSCRSSKRNLEKDPLSDQANELLRHLCQTRTLRNSRLRPQTIRRGTRRTSSSFTSSPSFTSPRAAAHEPRRFTTTSSNTTPPMASRSRAPRTPRHRASMQKAKWDKNADMRSLMKDASDSRNSKILPHRPYPAANGRAP